MRKQKIIRSLITAVAMSLALAPIQLYLPAFAQSCESAPSPESVIIEESARSEASQPKVALVLGGGGLRGAAHIGILRAFEREGIPIDIVVGTSMGAIVGGLYCAGVPVEQLKRELVPSFIAAYYSAPLPVQALKMNFSYLLLRKPQGLYNGNNLARLINSYVPKQRREIRNLTPKFAAVTTDLAEGSTQVLTEGDLSKAIEASTAIPLLRKPVVMGNALLVDGGAICNLPVDQAKHLGADFVIAVDVDEKIEPTDSKQLRRKIVKTTSRIITLMLAKLDESQKASADVCIQPDVTGISLLSRSNAEGQRALAAGEDAATKAMPELKMKMMLAGIKLRDTENIVSAQP